MSVWYTAPTALRMLMRTTPRTGPYVPGAARIINDAVHELTALRPPPNGRPVQLLVNCWYGRHRDVDRTTRGHTEQDHIPAMPSR